MIDFRAGSDTSIESPVRDSVDALRGGPLVVSISDIHGYLGAARSALKTVGDHEEFAPLVETDESGRFTGQGTTTTSSYSTVT